MISTGRRRLARRHRKVVKERHCLGGGDALVIDIPGDQYGIGLFPVDDLDDLGEDMFLILQHGDLVDTLAQVEIGEMDQLHSSTSADIPSIRCSLDSQRLIHRVLRALVENQVETANQISRYRTKICCRCDRQQYLLSVII